MTKPEGTEHVLERAEFGRPSPPDARGWRTYLDDDEQAVTVLRGVFGASSEHEICAPFFCARRRDGTAT